MPFQISTCGSYFTVLNREVKDLVVKLHSALLVPQSERYSQALWRIESVCKLTPQYLKIKSIVLGKICVCNLKNGISKGTA